MAVAITAAIEVQTSNRKTRTSAMLISPSIQPPKKAPVSVQYWRRRLLAGLDGENFGWPREGDILSPPLCHVKPQRTRKTRQVRGPWIDNRDSHRWPK